MKQNAPVGEAPVQELWDVCSQPFITTIIRSTLTQSSNTFQNSTVKKRSVSDDF